MAKQLRYTQRTLAHLRRLGYEADVCEKWIPSKGHPGGGVRRDLFGFLDVLCLHAECRVVIGVQSTSNGCLSDHFRKLRAEPRVGLWLDCGQELLVFGWKQTTARLKSGAPGKAVRWVPRVFRYTPDAWRAASGWPEEIDFGRRG